MLLTTLLAFAGLVHSSFASPELKVDGTRFIDRSGRTVILRGVNISNRSKVPPFLPSRSTAERSSRGSTRCPGLA